MRSRRRKGRDVNGWLALDKPKGLTSTRALGRVKSLLTPKKAGHAGTLDPLATGVLPLAFGEATKTVPFAMDSLKCYRFTVAWGSQTGTDDCEGVPIATSDKRPDLAAITALLPAFTGHIMQTPPQFSAIKQQGARACDLARNGKTVHLEPRPVTIERLTIVEHDSASQTCTTTFEAVCGKGTYVRALARDMGHELGCFGHVQALRRTRVGPFSERDTISLDKLEELRHSADPEALLRVLKPVDFVLDDIPAYEVSKADAARLKRGQPVLIRGPASALRAGLGAGAKGGVEAGTDAVGTRTGRAACNAPASGKVCAMSGGTLIALGEIRQGALHPSRIFHL